MLHEVTLGGTGKETGDRHPKVSDGVLIGAGAKILGNVRIGEGAKVGAGSVVLMDVPAHTTVAGVPAEVVGRPRVSVPSLHMDHSIEIDRMSVGAGPRRVGGGGEARVRRTAVRRALQESPREARSRFNAPTPRRGGRPASRVTPP